MVSIYTFTEGIEDELRRDIVFDGGIILFKGLSNLVALASYVQSFAEEVFSMDPLTAHERMDRVTYLACVEQFQREMTGSDKVKRSFAEIFSSLGLDLKETGCSRFTFRVQPPESSHIDRNTAVIGPHRDSWYNANFAQTNWWTAWYPLALGRNLKFHTKYWNKPVSNTSRNWEIEEFRRVRAEITERNGTFEELLSAYPYIEPLDPIDEDEALEFVLEPGDLLNFSLAHLHDGPPNLTRHARFSSDFRTLNALDILSERGAPNIDSHSTGDATGDFQRLPDQRPLAEMISNPDF